MAANHYESAIAKKLGEVARAGSCMGDYEKVCKGYMHVISGDVYSAFIHFHL